jgi:hypothetical protein
MSVKTKHKVPTDFPIREVYTTEAKDCGICRAACIEHLFYIEQQVSMRTVCNTVNVHLDDAEEFLLQCLKMVQQVKGETK